MLELDIATYLDEQGFGTYGEDIVVGEMPSSPNSCIAIYEYPGKPPSAPVDLDYPGLHIKVRNPSYISGKTIATNIRNALHTVANQAIHEGWYLSIFAVQSGAMYMGRDQNNRAEFVLNFQVTKRR